MERQRRVQDFFSSEIFSSGAESPLPLLRIFCPWLAEYLIITKKRLNLASAPFALHESFFHQGQKHNISNYIREICPTAGHASVERIKIIWCQVQKERLYSRSIQMFCCLQIPIFPKTRVSHLNQTYLNFNVSPLILLSSTLYSSAENSLYLVQIQHHNPKIDAEFAPSNV